MRKFLLSLVALCLLGFLAAGAYVALEGYRFLYNPPQSPGHEVILRIESGATFDQVARDLEEQGVITNAEYFRLLGKWRGQLASIQAGEFQLHTGWLPDQVLETLVSGKPILYKLSLREGLTWWQTAEAIAEQGFSTYEELEAVMLDPVILAEYNIPADSPEGYLFPETYLLDRSQKGDAEFIVRTLLDTFQKNAAELWPDGLPAPEDLHGLVILASMVEKETGQASERARIAGVYSSRLERSWLMQCDPTIIYGLGREFDGNIRRSHLEDASNPYNTYVHAGLPPGPIASFGQDALKAAKEPEEHEYLFFVAKGDGSHYFSKSLREHNKAVQKYQLNR